MVESGQKHFSEHLSQKAEVEKTVFITALSEKEICCRVIKE
jgi:hypothetical protein